MKQTISPGRCVAESGTVIAANANNRRKRRWRSETPCSSVERGALPRPESVQAPFFFTAFRSPG